MLGDQTEPDCPSSHFTLLHVLVGHGDDDGFHDEDDDVDGDGACDGNGGDDDDDDDGGGVGGQGILRDRQPAPETANYWPSLLFTSSSL